MFRNANKPRYTTSVSKSGLVVEMYDDGWENLVSSKQQFASETEGRAYLLNTGWEEYDANADLKAKGMVWNGYCYAMPN